MKNRSTPVTFLSEALAFPPVSHANEDGLLAVGGDLQPERLLLAYRSGIFPWFNDDALILWWSPDPRMVLFPEKIRVSKSMRKVLRDGGFSLTKNRCFNEVIEACSRVKRPGQAGTWITGMMREAYRELHRRGHAVSYEVWHKGRLAGGLYGIDLGHVFCGESMFSLVSNASKYAMVQLARESAETGRELIDCQMYTDHLARMGAEEIPRANFLEILNPGAKTEGDQETKG